MNGEFRHHRPWDILSLQETTPSSMPRQIFDKGLWVTRRQSQESGKTPCHRTSLTDLIPLTGRCRPAHWFILMASSSGMIKILPSPISPVRAACWIAATAFSTYYLFIGLYYQLFHFVNFGCKITTLRQPITLKCFVLIKIFIYYLRLDCIQTNLISY